MIDVRLLRRVGEEKDSICIKVNHACCDGSALKELSLLFSKIYTSLFKGEDLKVKSNLVSETQASIDPNNNVSNGINKLSFKSNWPLPSTIGDNILPTVEIWTLESEIYNRIVRFSKKKAVSINDIIMSVYYLTLEKIIKPKTSEDVEIAFTVDLRKWLQPNNLRRISNLSGVELIRFTIGKFKEFNHVLRFIHKITSSLKLGQLGYESVLVLSSFEKLNFNNLIRIFEVSRKRKEL